jgi:hypothetical protein
MSLYKDVTGPVWAFRGLALLIALLLFVQPVLIGQYLGHANSDWKDVHGYMGEPLALLTLILTIFAYLSRRTFGIGMTGHCGAMLVLIVIQTILGHEGSDNRGTALAIHVPLGVLLFGMGSYIPFLSFFDLKAQRMPNQPDTR